ncbi:MAG: hypothetical protein RIB59_06130, partial [Rhodospirillales bacterium]
TSNASLSKEEREKIRIGASKIFIWGKISYSDVFDVRHNTFFCYMFFGEKIYKNEPNPANNGPRTRKRDVCWHPRND